jgi:hypothetical protein
MTRRYRRSGWTTANQYDVAKVMINYQPIIDAVERKVPLHDEHPLIVQMLEKIRTKLGNVYVNTYGINGLEVVKVGDGGVYIVNHESRGEVCATLDHISKHLL